MVCINPYMSNGLTGSSIYIGSPRFAIQSNKLDLRSHNQTLAQTRIFGLSLFFPSQASFVKRLLELGYFWLHFTSLVQIPSHDSSSHPIHSIHLLFCERGQSILAPDYALFFYVPCSTLPIRSFDVSTARCSTSFSF